MKSDSLLCLTISGPEKVGKGRTVSAASLYVSGESIDSI